MATLEIQHPVAEVVKASVAAAPRLDGLAGKTIGLFWNMKAGGDVALQAVADVLVNRHPGVRFHNYVGSVGSIYRQATPEDITRMAAECDAVISSSGD